MTYSHAEVNLQTIHALEEEIAHLAISRIDVALGRDRVLFREPLTESDISDHDHPAETRRG